MDDFVVQAKEELIEFEQRLLNENEDVKKLITTVSKRFKFVEYEGVKVKVMASIPFDVRKKANELKKISETTDETGEDFLESQKPMYELLASICLDAPYNDWRTWYVVDKNANGAPTILSEVLRAISQSEKQITRFR